MTNAATVYSLCNAIVNTFFPDRGAIDVVLLNYGIAADDMATARDGNIFRAARDLCLGYVESSRAENGISTSVRSDDAIRRALRHWCRAYGLDEEEELGDSLVVIDDATHRW